MKLTVINGNVFIIPRIGERQKCIPMEKNKYLSHAHTLGVWRLAKDNEIERSYPALWSEYQDSLNIKNFEELKKDELIELAKKEGVELPSGATKDEIKEILLKNK